MWEIVASLAQKLALTLAPVPGAQIYISGGVSNYLSPFFKRREELFWKVFSKHNHMQSLLNQIEVFVLNENPTLDGLQSYYLTYMK